jgi:hypothetical protein
VLLVFKVLADLKVPQVLLELRVFKVHPVLVSMVLLVQQVLLVSMVPPVLPAFRVHQE